MLGDLLRTVGETSGAGITFAEGHVTYPELIARAHGVAGELRRRGVEPGDRVAMLIDSTPSSVAAALGTWMAGATVMSVPVPPRERLGGETRFYRDGVGVLIRDHLLVGPDVLGTALGREVIAPETLDVGPAADLGVPTPPTALVQFTSGSTGSPKGVVISSGALSGHIRTIGDALEGDGSRDVAVSWLPLSHDMGLVGCLLSSLAASVPLVLMPPRTFVRNPRTWLDLCASHRATITCAPDFAYRMAATVLETTGTPTGDLSSLRVCLSGAERVAWSTIERFAAATESAGLAPESVMPVYGMAEATLAVTFPEMGRGPRVDEGGHVALGRPLPGVEIRVRDGRIALRGPHLFDGYLTRDGFVRPFDEDGWFTTNDVGAVDADGELYVHGRTDEAVISRGRNVFAEDVELVAAESEGVLPLGVAAFRSPCGAPRFGLAMEVLSAPDADLHPVARDIQAAVTRSLGIRVSPVVFLAPKALPRTTSGKVKRAACRAAHVSDGWPDGAVIASVA